MVMCPWIPVSLSSTTEAALFGIAFFAWAGSEIIGSIILPRLRHRRDGIKLERKDQNSALAVNIGIIASVYIAFCFSLVRVAVLPDWVFYPGHCTHVRRDHPAPVVHRYTGGYFSVMVSIQEGQIINPERAISFHPPPVLPRDTPDIDRDRACCLQSWGALLTLLVMFGIVYRLPDRC